LDARWLNALGRDLFSSILLDRFERAVRSIA
jgi:hypothetical protein